MTERNDSVERRGTGRHLGGTGPGRGPSRNGPGGSRAGHREGRAAGNRAAQQGNRVWRATPDSDEHYVFAIALCGSLGNKLTGRTSKSL